jgi:flagellar motor switch protein FliG
MAWLVEPTDDVLQVLAQQLRHNLEPHLNCARGRAQSLAGLHAVLNAMDHAARARVLEGLASRNRSLSRHLGHQAASNPPPASSSSQDVVSFRYRLERPDDRPRRVDSLVDFDDFAAFGDPAICRIFAAADPQVVLLALTGADEALLARILRQFPPRDAARLRARLNHPGPVRLRDIEAAQEQLADLARRLAEQGVIELPVTRHFAAAA